MKTCVLKPKTVNRLMERVPPENVWQIKILVLLLHTFTPTHQERDKPAQSVRLVAPLENVVVFTGHFIHSVFPISDWYSP